MFQKDKVTELQVVGKNVEISQEVRSYLERKLTRLTRHLPDISQVEVEITREMTKAPEHRYVVQVTMSHGNTILRGEERAAHLYATIDSVMDVMERQIERYKGRLLQRKRGASISKIEVSPTAEEEHPGKIVKIKRFVVKPMPVEEAIEQMELLGHDFFIFLDDATAKFNVLYRRSDGDYGLIQPELA